jgi:hypothetical protein
MDVNELAQIAYDRSEIADTLYRYCFALDEGAPDLLASVFTDDCVFDFTPAGAKLGIDFPAISGRDSVVKALIPMIGPLDTSHTASNIHVGFTGDTATMQASLMSQHFMPGEGPRRGSDYALLMNRYQAELVRDGSKWRFKRVVIDNAWANGDPGIITALAIHRVARAKTKPK